MGNSNSRGPKAHKRGGRRGFPAGTFPSKAGKKDVRGLAVLAQRESRPNHRRGGW